MFVCLSVLLQNYLNSDGRIFVKFVEHVVYEPEKTWLNFGRLELGLGLVHVLFSLFGGNDNMTQVCTVQYTVPSSLLCLYVYTDCAEW